MQTIRSFISVPLSPEVEHAARKLIQYLASDGDGIKWVPTDTLHLTLKFLGDVDNFEVPKICDVIRNAVADVEPFDLVFSGAGGMPSLDRPRVICAGVQDESGSLCEIVKRLEVDLAELGFKQEPRDYRPHLTLGRPKGSRKKASQALQAALGDERRTNLGTMMVDHMQLMASFLDKHGPTYQVMDTIDFD
ncbi:RNA 2',3'-cyclic phosphodiesterase [Rubripirellula amarantea]|nr:RNA 2',3'-cyclic phosphodiesterase [Rubripirellula amarantea]MDA8746151.1 RNA 2',3'-cyclic phosphodiesterase [Rubripirellula amarantea]